MHDLTSDLRLSWQSVQRCWRCSSGAGDSSRSSKAVGQIYQHQTPLIALLQLCAMCLLLSACRCRGSRKLRRDEHMQSSNTAVRSYHRHLLVSLTRPVGHWLVLDLPVNLPAKHTYQQQHTCQLFGPQHDHPSSTQTNHRPPLSSQQTHTRLLSPSQPLRKHVTSLHTTQVRTAPLSAHKHRAHAHLPFAAAVRRCGRGCSYHMGVLIALVSAGCVCCLQCDWRSCAPGRLLCCWRGGVPGQMLVSSSAAAQLRETDWVVAIGNSHEGYSRSINQSTIVTSVAMRCTQEVMQSSRCSTAATLACRAQQMPGSQQSTVVCLWDLDKAKGSTVRLAHRT